MRIIMEGGMMRKYTVMICAAMAFALVVAETPCNVWATTDTVIINEEDPDVNIIDVEGDEIDTLLKDDASASKPDISMNGSSLLENGSLPEKEMLSNDAVLIDGVETEKEREELNDNSDIEVKEEVKVYNSSVEADATEQVKESSDEDTDNKEVKVYYAGNVVYGIDNNSEKQNYDVWANPSCSALTSVTDGRLMSVTESSDESIVVAYLNSSYELINTMRIALELPLYGGFFASTDGYYYIASGQNNPSESDSVEVFRITKYDSNWKKIAHASIFGADTKTTYRYGSCDFAESGRYLLVHTCHEMYKASDGRNHQSNFTFQIDKTNMKQVDILYSGYVSHSLNQFVRNDNGYAVCVDHGDGFPRAVVIGKYNDDLSDGIIGSVNNYTHTNAITIPGECGYSFTGVSVGGFEISDRAYLIAVNTVDLSGTYNVYGTRNAAIVVVPKAGNGFGTPVQHMLTSHAQGETGVNTPRLVKISTNRFLMLWSRNGIVYYAELDGNGNSGTTYSFKGALSDCNPIVYNGNVVWYAYHGFETDFYKISISDISKSSIARVCIEYTDTSNFDCKWYKDIETGKSYWYERGVRQGTYNDLKAVVGDGTVRGREIYDPESNAWYWLDSVYDGAKAVGKEVWMPYIYQDEDKWSDTDKRRIAYESDEGMGEQVYKAIRNKEGKWVRYDENGKMIKGWITIYGRLAELYPKQKGNRYYYDNRTGLMAKGWTVIDGRTYYFDEITGVLKR